VKEIYAEVNIPIVADAAFAKKLDLSLAERYSDYNTFGGESTGKIGVRWQINDEFLLRGTYAEGFRAPFIGELFGSAQFGATLTDPCSGNVTANCAALGVPPGYTQIDTQITTTTGGNPNLDPESSESYTVGAVYSPGWATNTDWSQRFDIEATYYHDDIDDAIKAPDAQDRLNLCVASGNPNSVFCQGISRNASGNINRFNNLLANLGEIKTSGVDIKLNYAAPAWDWGQFTAALQSTHVITYEAIGTTGERESRRPGVEENDGSIPEWQTSLTLGWRLGDWDATFSSRYISGVTEICVDTDLGPCSNPTTGFNHLGSTTYSDLQVGWNQPFGATGLRVDVGVNNLFDRDPPKCGSCTLNGYDASTYEVPGRFYYLEATYKF
jgi:iron complex outermembrane receptor protein